MDRQRVLQAGTLFTGNGEVLHDMAVLIADGRIAQIGKDIAAQPDADVLDLSRHFVMPGFIDAHTHLTLWAPFERNEFQTETPYWATRAAREMLASGVTTVRDVGGVNYFDLALRNSIAKGEVAGPRMLAAGKFVEPTGGHVHYWARQADGVAEVQKAVREQIAAGVDIVKLMASGGAANAGENPDRMHFRPEEMRAAVIEAQEAGKRVAVHAHPARVIQLCAEIGVTSVEHAKRLDEATIPKVLEHGMWVVPTQAVYKRMADNIDGHPQGKVDIARKVWEEKVPTLKEAIKAGVKIGVGTDCGRHFPHSEFVTEMIELEHAGMTRQQVLLAATKGNAELLGLSDDGGTIDVGKRDIFVALTGNPLDDLDQARKVEWVIQGGIPLSPDALYLTGRV